MTTTPSWLEADLGIEGVHIRVTTRAGGRQSAALEQSESG